MSNKDKVLELLAELDGATDPSGAVSALLDKAPEGTLAELVERLDGEKHRRVNMSNVNIAKSYTE